MKILSPRKRSITVEYSLYYARVGAPGGFSFRCDRDGVVDASALNPTSEGSLAACRAGVGTSFERPVVHDYERKSVEPAIGECDDCGRNVALEGFTNTCSCGADYNSFGQRLAPRSQWGEETGEPLADILSIP